MRALTLVALLCATTTAVPLARAQSKKYPPVAPDKDLEAERTSKVWTAALDPDRGPYQDLVRDAKRLIDHNDASDVRTALEKLDAAVARMPKEPDAYAVRGQIYLQERQWQKCADDLGAAESFSKIDDQLLRTRSRIDLGVCQARAGRYADSEQTLVRAVASAPGYKAELMMRLGEVRIGLGKLDEAIDALEASIDATDSANDSARWLLALAYDRARRPTDAQQAAMDAKRYDQSFTYITSPRQPFLGEGDTDYLEGLAYLYALPRPEYALLYFRHYLAGAGESPWKRRAEEHVRDLSALKFPTRDSLVVNIGNVDVDAVRDALEKPMPQLRECVAKTPGIAYSVSITRNRIGPVSRETPMYRIPIEGVTAGAQLPVFGTATKVEIDAASGCLEKAAEKIALPRPKDVNSYYRANFVVIAP